MLNSIPPYILVIRQTSGTIAIFHRPSVATAWWSRYQPYLMAYPSDSNIRFTWYRRHSFQRPIKDRIPTIYDQLPKRSIEDDYIYSGFRLFENTVIGSTKLIRNSYSFLTLSWQTLRHCTEDDRRFISSWSGPHSRSIYQSANTRYIWFHQKRWRQIFWLSWTMLFWLIIS